MLKLIASIALAAAIASLPRPGFAQMAEPGASAPRHTQAHHTTRSHRSEMRRRGNMHKERARAGAEHVRKM
jgi:hypothetical protein